MSNSGEDAVRDARPSRREGGVRRRRRHSGESGGVAHGTSDQPWLHVGRRFSAAAAAFVPLRVASVPGQPGETLHAIVSITANGNQRFVVPVTLVVGTRPSLLPSLLPGAKSAPRAVPKPAPAAAPLPVPSRPRPLPVRSREAGQLDRGAQDIPPRRVAASCSCWPLVLRDAICAGRRRPPSAGRRGRSGAAHRNPLSRRQERRRAGKTLAARSPADHALRLVMLHEARRSARAINVKRLTFDPWGRTNNTCLRFDGNDERLFGGTGGRWEDASRQGLEGRAGPGARRRHARSGSATTRRSRSPSSSSWCAASRAGFSTPAGCAIGSRTEDGQDRTGRHPLPAGHLHRRQRRRAVHHPRRQRPVRHDEGPAETGEGQENPRLPPGAGEAGPRPSGNHRPPAAEAGGPGSRRRASPSAPGPTRSCASWTGKAAGPSTLWDVPLLSA